MILQYGGSAPWLFDAEISRVKCQVNSRGEANCDHVHARDLPSQNAGGWAGEGEELVPEGWTAQSPPTDPRLGQQMYECGLCHDVMTLEETTSHVCGAP